MLFKIYYVRDNNIHFVNVPAENLIDSLNTLRKSENTKLLWIRDWNGERFRFIMV